MAQQIVTLEYSFSLQKGVQKTFTIRLKSPSMELEPSAAPPFPQWTRLGFHQCPGCPLKADVHPHCPVAVGLVEVIEFFSNGVSHDEADITIRGPNREYRKRAPLQDAVGSLACSEPTCGCLLQTGDNAGIYFSLMFTSPAQSSGMNSGIISVMRPMW